MEKGIYIMSISNTEQNAHINRYIELRDNIKEARQKLNSFDSDAKETFDTIERQCTPKDYITKVKGESVTVSSYESSKGYIVLIPKQQTVYWKDIKPLLLDNGVSKLIIDKCEAKLKENPTYTKDIIKKGN
tara:strand:+ start:69 stop:461 length:393 start_codon:yes stop_codon:yes gene_type:complete